MKTNTNKSTILKNFFLILSITLILPEIVSAKECQNAFPAPCTVQFNDAPYIGNEISAKILIWTLNSEGVPTSNELYSETMIKTSDYVLPVLKQHLQLKLIAMKGLGFCK